MTELAIELTSHKQLTPSWQVWIEGISPVVIKLVDTIAKHPLTHAAQQRVENNPWHNHEQIDLHQQAVFTNLQILLQLEWIANQDIRTQYQTYLEAIPFEGGTLNRKNLLLAACALHDFSKGANRPAYDAIAPNKTYVFVTETGETKGPGHELASSSLALPLLQEAGLQGTDLTSILHLVSNHDAFNIDVCNKILSSVTDRQPAADAAALQLAQPFFAFELAVHIWADEYGAAVTKELRTYVGKTVLAHFYLPKALYTSLR
jgi:hypothetical protein